MRRWLRLGALLTLLLSVSYVAYLKSSIHSKEALILSIPQLMCFYGSSLLGLTSILVLLADGIIGITHRIQRFRMRRAKRRP